MLLAPALCVLITKYEVNSGQYSEHSMIDGVGLDPRNQKRSGDYLDTFVTCTISSLRALAKLTKLFFLKSEVLNLNSYSKLPMGAEIFHIIGHCRNTQRNKKKRPKNSVKNF